MFGLQLALIFQVKVADLQESMTIATVPLLTLMCFYSTRKGQNQPVTGDCAFNFIGIP